MLKLVVLLIALLQTAFMLVEVFYWPWLARRVAGYSEDIANATWRLGINQGIYNGFLAAGLVFALYGPFSNEASRAFLIFTLLCIAIAGFTGAVTMKKASFLLAQTLPAAVAIAIILGTAA